MAIRFYFLYALVWVVLSVNSHAELSRRGNDLDDELCSPSVVVRSTSGHETVETVDTASSI
jgi:hypothetical protein